MKAPIKFLPIFAVAALNMGNQSCQQAKDNARHLKMSASVGNITAQNITLPTGEIVDFPYVANTLFYNQVYTNDYFIQVSSVADVVNAANGTPTSNTPTKLSLAAMKTLGKTAANPTSTALDPAIASDAALLTKYGFGAVAAAASASDGLHIRNVVINSQADVPSCLYTSPQAQLSGSVVSFSESGGGGISIGFPSAGPVTEASGSVNITDSQLSMVFDSYEPFWGSRPKVSTDAVVTSSKVAFAVDLMSMVGLNFFMDTPVSNTIKKGMQNGLNAIVSAYEATDGGVATWNAAWESRVLYSPTIANNNTQIAIAAGSNAYVKVGDEFLVTNMNYEWTGNACTSTFKDSTMAVPTLGQVVIKIIETGEYASVGTVVGNPLYEGNILPGAMVRIQQLAADTTASPTPMPAPGPSAE